MKTIDIVTTAKGWYVTRRYCGMNKGTQFFFSVAPANMKKKDAKQFLDNAIAAKENYIKNWMGE